ncbi:MAG: hypothetical protein EZS28_015571 [Streblomastix strix]|uniref:Protein kinase domain-containing protein n=1 Tax=Streblomastix strix TaxID=222440 RepID=A0A5J4W2G5_9EUKA|nr:MAG: hypothetical protein EZS28_015571 [Streblomastix strix]
MQTLSIIAKQPHIPLPSYTLRALMKQILEGLKIFHAVGLVHRDIKCCNILLDNPPGSGLVHVKIADFGLAKVEDTADKKTYGTLQHMAPELFLIPIIYTEKVDLYAAAITFYRIITHRYPVNQQSFNAQQKALKKLKAIDRPDEIIDNLLWDLLSKMLEFQPDQRISAAKALQHPYFTSPEAITDVSLEQKDIALFSRVSEMNGDLNITEQILHKKNNKLRRICVI